MKEVGDCNIKYLEFKNILYRLQFSGEKGFGLKLGPKLVFGPKQAFKNSLRVITFDSGVRL